MSHEGPTARSPKNGSNFGGGAIFNGGGTLGVNNSTFFMNGSYYDGGIYNDAGKLTVNNRKFILNNPRGRIVRTESMKSPRRSTRGRLRQGHGFGSYEPRTVRCLVFC